MSPTQDRLRQSLQLAVASVVFLTLIVGCADKDKADNSAAAKLPVATPARSPDSASAAITPPPACPFTGQGACAGVLNASFLTAPTWDELKDAKHALDQKDGSYREVVCPGACPKEQYGTTFVNRDSRRIYLENLPDDKVVVVGAIRLKAGVRAEKKYGVGEDVEDDQDARTFVFVAYHVPQSPGNNGTIIAGWKLFAVTGHGNDKHPVYTGKSGNITQCTKKHPGRDTDDPDSYFLTCLADHKLSEIATQNKLSFKELLHAIQCDAASKAECTKQRESKVAGLKSLSLASQASLLKQLMDELDPTKDPYWFSCAVGCCTADT